MVRFLLQGDASDLQRLIGAENVVLLELDHESALARLIRDACQWAMIDQHLQNVINRADLSYFDHVPFAVGQIGARLQISSNISTRAEVQIDHNASVHQLQREVIFRLVILVQRSIVQNRTVHRLRENLDGQHPLVTRGQRLVPAVAVA